MKWVSASNGSGLYVEVRQRSLRVLHGEQTLLIPIERQPNGRLTSAAKTAASQALKTLAGTINWRRRSKAWCAIDARGVSLRRLSLPASANGDVQRMLRLQIENEFPMPPESLAWGFSRVEIKRGKLERHPGTDASTQRSTDGVGNHFTIVALKKEALDDYAQIFASAGVTPIFTVAALARAEVCPDGSGSFSVLDIGRTQSELISFAGGNPETLRILPWGGDSITRAIEQKLGVSSEQAEQLKTEDRPLPNGETGQKLQAALAESLAPLARALGSNCKGEKLYLTGRGSRYHELPERLSELMPAFIKCERIEAADGPTAALVGLRKLSQSNQELPLILRQQDIKSSDLRNGSQSPFGFLAIARNEIQTILAQPALRKWARLALLLCICIIVFPYAQAFLFKPILAKKLKKIRAEAGRLQVIDRELGFMQHLKNVQPPYLDTLTVLANAAPPGTRFDNINLNRRGELSLKGNMGNAQQVVDFRAKLIKSAFFSSVTVEEQTPSPDRQRMSVRIVAQCKPAGARPIVKPEPLPPGFTPGSGMPFPGMMPMPGGPMVAVPPPIPGAQPMVPGGPGPISGPPGGRAARSFQARYGLSPDSAGVTISEQPKPVIVEEKKTGP